MTERRPPDPSFTIQNTDADVWITGDRLVSMVFRDDQDRQLEVTMKPESCLEWLEIVRKAAQQLIDEKKACNAEGGSA